MPKTAQNMPSPSRLTANGTYYFDVQQLTPYLSTLKGVWGGATAVLYYYDTQSDGYRAVDGGSWSADMEERFVCPSGGMMLEIQSASGTTNLTFNYGPINQPIR